MHHLDQRTKNNVDVEFQPILRWAGSKKTVLKKLEGNAPSSYERYIELFAGSACLFFKLNPSNGIIADSNQNLIEFYNVFSKNPEDVYEIFSSFPRESEVYYTLRENIKYEKNIIKKAALFLYLNRNCFNGIYRTNMQGHFNVPFSENRIAAYPSTETIFSAANRLKEAEIVCGDFEDICTEHVKSGDFVYLDPPYYVPNVRVFREYSGKPFTECDFGRLASLLDFIDDKDSKFLLSYPDCKLARSLSKKWNSSRILVKRIIGGSKESRKNKYELLIKNY